MPSIQSRNNPQIWRIAEWLWEECVYGVDGDEACEPWERVCKEYKDEFYDKALELQRKMINNEFTGSDTHKD